MHVLGDISTLLFFFYCFFFLTSCFLFCFHHVQADGKRVVLDAGLKAVSLDSGVPLVCS